MPKQYEAIRDKFESKGMGVKEAEGHAARIYNAGRPKGAKPVTRYGDEGHKPGKGHKRMVRKLTGK